MDFFPRTGPKVEGAEAKEVVTWVEEEFRRLTRTLDETGILRLQVLHVAPEKPREGMIAWADGTNWNPGSGAGPYANIGGTWTRLKP